MSLEIHSDYGSGSSMNSLKSWGSQDTEDLCQLSKVAVEPPPIQKTASFLDLVLGRCSLEDAMREFRLNGSDAPYNPDEDGYSKRAPPTAPAPFTYRRQTSWPAPEMTPTLPLPQPPTATTLLQPPTATTLLQPPTATTLLQPPIATTLLQPDAQHITPLLQPAVEAATLVMQPKPTLIQQSTIPATMQPELPTKMLQPDVASLLPGNTLQSNVWSDLVGYDEVFQINEPVKTFTTSTPILEDPLTCEQRRVLSSLSDDAVYALLRQLELARAGDDKRQKRNNLECRFCKNNGERESYYRSHSLKDAGGAVRCPVLRRYRCARCHATGDRAHTAKYCPLTTANERIKSSAMMRSVRLSSGRHRRGAQPQYVVFGETPSTVVADTMVTRAALQPEWAALEQKLLMW